jgi:4-amino-4-deoxy-L-arabinose transferase-like glycosyltransferase
MRVGYCFCAWIKEYRIWNLEFRMKKIIVYIVLTIILLFGSFFRLYRLTEVPYGFMQDEAVAGYDAFSILQTGKDHHGVFMPLTFQSFNDWTSPLLTYMLVPAIKLLGLNVLAVRLPIVLLSCISILLIYLIGKEIFHNKEMGLVCAFLFSCSSFAFTSARWTIPTHTVVFPLLSGIYFLVLASNNKKRKTLFSSMGFFFLGLTLYTHPPLKLFIPLIAPVFFLFIYGRKLSKLSILSLLVLFFTALPILIDNMNHFGLYSNRFKMISIFSIPQFWPFEFLRNYISYLFPFTLFLPNSVSPVTSLPGFGYELYAYAVFYYFGLFRLIRNILIKPFMMRKTSILLLVYLLISFIPVSLLMPAGFYQRAIYAMPVIIIVSSYGVYSLYQGIKNRLSDDAAKIFMIFFIFAAGMNFLFFTSVYFGKNNEGITKYYFQYGLDKVIGYLNKKDSKYKSIIFSDVINMPYSYVLFYTKYDPNKLVYSDFQKVGENGWLKVTNFGKYQFRKIMENELAGAEIVKTIENSPISDYLIYEKGERAYIVFGRK